MSPQLKPVRFNGKLQPAICAIGSNWPECKKSIPTMFFFSIHNQYMYFTTETGGPCEVQLTLVCATWPPLVTIVLSFPCDELPTALLVFFSFLCCTVADWPTDPWLWTPVLFEADFPLNLASPWPFLRNVLWGFWLAFWAFVSALEALIR